MKASWCDSKKQGNPERKDPVLCYATSLEILVLFPFLVSLPVIFSARVTEPHDRGIAGYQLCFLLPLATMAETLSPHCHHRYDPDSRTDRCDVPGVTSPGTGRVYDVLYFAHGQ